MLSLQKRKPFLSDSEVRIDTCEFWVQFHNIPLEGRSAANIRLMAEGIGRVIEIEDPQDRRFSSRGFGRARVEIDVEKPLVPGFVAPRPGGLKDVWIKVKYEKLARFCFNCGRLGHESRNCEEEGRVWEGEEGSRGYDASMGAQAFLCTGGLMERRDGVGTRGKGGLYGKGGAFNEVRGSRLLERGECSKGSLSEEFRGWDADRSQTFNVAAMETGGGGLRSNRVGLADSNEWRMGGGEKCLGLEEEAQVEKGRGWARAGKGRLGVHSKDGLEMWKRNGPKECGGVSGLKFMNRISGARALGGSQELGMVIGELGNCINRINLKRRAEEEWELPGAKRWQDGFGDSKIEPGEAEDRSEHRAGADDSRSFGEFRFEGTVLFSLGKGFEEGKSHGQNKKKARQSLVIKEIREQETESGGAEGEAESKELYDGSNGFGGCPESATGEP